MNARPKYQGPEMEFARSVKAAVAGAAVVAVLLLVAATQGRGVVDEATASQQPAQTSAYEYFPATFAIPEGAVLPHIEAF